MPEIYDTTLRDGAQMEGLSLTVEDKLRIASLIDGLGVHFIEGGWPGASPKDTEFFRRAPGEIELENAALVAFGSTCRPGASAATDEQLQALLDAGTAVVCIVGKSWDYHVTEALRTDLDENLRIIRESIAFLRANGRRVFFDAEHFFDGFEANAGYALAVAQEAAAAGAERVVLCDTNGGSVPARVTATVAAVATAHENTRLGIHAHNDAGCAVANSLAAVEAGVVQVQGCINGYGERTGNADLCAVLPDLVLKMGIPVVSEDSLRHLAPTAHHIAEIVNIVPDPHRPYVGTSAFAHKAGLHTSALARRPDAYEHIDPARVGNTTRMVVSEMAGRSTMFAKAREAGVEMDGDQAAALLARVKELEHRGYQLEAADGTFELLSRTVLGTSREFFELESFRVHTERRAGGEVIAEATVKLRVGGDRIVMTREGDGPVNALDNALRAALVPTYPQIEAFHLTDYRVRVVDPAAGTGAVVRVLLELTDGNTTWGTIGVHENIIEASWEAVADAMTVGLLRSLPDGPALL